MVLEVLKANKTVENAVDTFVKTATWLFLAFATISFLVLWLGFEFNFSLGFGI